jgi:hypothetical protein
MRSWENGLRNPIAEDRRRSLVLDSSLRGVRGGSREIT